MEVGAQIMLLRDRKGLSREFMADALGIHVNTYKNIEYGKKIPNLQEIQKIADVLDIDPSAFLGATTTIFSKIKNSPGTGIGNHVINEREILLELTSSLRTLTHLLSKIDDKLS